MKYLPTFDISTYLYMLILYTCSIVLETFIITGLYGATEQKNIRVCEYQQKYLLLLLSQILLLELYLVRSIVNNGLK